MANFVYITLDTTAPSNPILAINGGAVFTTSQLVSLTISVDDADKTGYSMLIWGDVDPTYDVNVKATDTTSVWMPYNNSPQIKLSNGDGSKTISMRVRDDVYNASSLASRSIALDMSLPTVLTTTPDVAKISENAGKNSTSFTYSSNEAFSEFKVKLVNATGASENTGTLIPATAGSTNISGVAGNYTAGQVLTITVKGTDLKTAGAISQAQSILKVFVKDMSGQWSV